MKIGRRRFLLLLLLAGVSADRAAPPRNYAGTKDSVGVLGSRSNSVGTQHAPVDGKDGIPHEGPWVETNAERERKKAKVSIGDDVEDQLSKTSSQNSRYDTGAKDQSIPQSNEGVMDDKSRSSPVEGTRGTEGGISEKSQVKDTPLSDAKKPEMPKEALPLPHSELEKIKGADTPIGDGDQDSDAPPNAAVPTRNNLLSKPTDLPDIDGVPQRKPATVDDPSDLYHDHSLHESFQKSDDAIPHDQKEDIVQPMHSLFLAFTMIIFSEIGDKTFLVACLMAMRHDRLLVFSAAISALITMTILSAVLGHAVPTLIPKWLTNFLAAGLFLVFGIKMLIEARGISPDEGVSEEMKEVEMELEEKEHEALRRSRRRSSISPYVLEAGRGVPRKSHTGTGGRLPSPPESPISASSSREASPSRASRFRNAVAGLENLFSLLLSPAWVQTFVMTFLGEWGDRSQIATIAMAAGSDYWWVTAGSILGHCICTGIAVIGGKAIAGKVSLRTVTMGGAIAFLVFGVIYLLEAVY